MTNPLPRVTHEVEQYFTDRAGTHRHMKVNRTADDTYHIEIDTQHEGAAPSRTVVHLSSIGFGLLAGLIGYAVGNLQRHEVSDAPA
jgi:hypothetical protein